MADTIKEVIVKTTKKKALSEKQIEVLRLGREKRQAMLLAKKGQPTPTPIPPAPSVPTSTPTPTEKPIVKSQPSQPIDIPKKSDTSDASPKKKIVVNKPKSVRNVAGMRLMPTTHTLMF